MAEKRRTFTAEFKREAVALVLAQAFLDKHSESRETALDVIPHLR